MSVDPGKGYGIVLNGQNMMEGDECWSFSRNIWFPVQGHGNWVVSEGLVLRRKIPGKPIRLYTTCNDLGVIGGVAYATEQDLPADNVREIKVDPSTGTLYVDDGHGRPSGEA